MIRPPNGQHFEGLTRDLCNPLDNIDADGNPYQEKALVEAHEATHCVIGLPDATAAIRFELARQRLGRPDLERQIGTRAPPADVLNGKRPLTRAMIG